MTLHAAHLRQPHTVTFDCWATLLYEGESTGRPDERARVVATFTGVGEDDARAALQTAWRRHQTLWHRRTVCTGADMTRLTLTMLGAKLEPLREELLIATLEEQILEREVRALEGAREALRVLAQAGVRRALICDTGFTPGRVVRKLLDRVGLLEFLEVTVFSDELGVPKPEAAPFHSALEALGTSCSGAVHVGDLRRSDIAGARRARMGAIRLRARHDDADDGPARGSGVIDCNAAGCEPACERPEADAVVGSYPELLGILGYR